MVLEAAIANDLSVDRLSRSQRARLRAVVVEQQHGDRRLSVSFAGVSTETVRRWLQRQDGELDIWDAARPGRPALYGKDVQSRFIGFYCQTTPLPDCGRWSLRWAEEHLHQQPGVVGGALSRSTMQRFLADHHLHPHRSRYFLQVTDPDFFPKMEKIIALYGSDLKYLFCFDECPGIQILQRIAPHLRPTDDEAIRRWWEEFEYVRHGTTDLFAFLNVRSGEIDASFHSNHKKEVFLERWRSHVDSVAVAERVDYVMDNLDSHCCYEFCEAVAELSDIRCPPKKELDSRQKRRDWLEGEQKRIVIHFTPFHGSWLNMAEICFRIIGQKCLKDSYSSPQQLHAAVMAFIEVWNRHWAHPFDWGYDGGGLRRKVVARFLATLTHSAPTIRLQYLTKSCRLMINLIAENHADCDPGQWERLSEALGSQEHQLRDSITESGQPIVKRNAEAALNALVDALARRDAIQRTAAVT